MICEAWEIPGRSYQKIKTQKEFDSLFPLIFHENRMVVMRAADVIEKISITRPVYLSKYKNQLLELCDAATNKKLKWHLALLLSRLQLINKEFDKAWNMLRQWAKDSTNSRIVRVNAIQALFELTCPNPAVNGRFGFIGGLAILFL